MGQQILRMLSVEGVDQPEEAVGILRLHTSEDACATMYDRAPCGSPAQTLVFALDRLVTELRMCTFDDGKHLIPPRVPARSVRSVG